MQLCFRKRWGNDSLDNEKLMLSEISWGNYLAGVSVFLICYYSIIILVYYREEVRSFLNHSSIISSETVEPGQMLTNDNQLAELENTVKNIDSILERAGSELDKSELLSLLRPLLANFPGLAIPAWKVAIYNHIINESAAQCGITIGEEDLDRKG